MWQFITEYWAGWLCALIGGAILAAIPKIKALWDAVLALLHDRIYTECYRFMELGYITRDGLRTVDWRDTAHMRLYRQFVFDPEGFLQEALEGEI